MHVAEVLVVRETDLVGGLPADVGLPLLDCGLGEGLSQVGPLDDLEVEGLGVAEVDEELVGAHFDDVFLPHTSSTYVSRSLRA